MPAREVLPASFAVKKKKKVCGSKEHLCKCHKFTACWGSGGAC